MLWFAGIFKAVIMPPFRWLTIKPCTSQALDMNETQHDTFYLHRFPLLLKIH